jgi:hypothetical protein
LPLPLFPSLSAGSNIALPLADGTSLKGWVKEVMDGAVVVKVEQSEGPGALAKGEHSIAADKIYKPFVFNTRVQRFWRFTPNF